MRSNLENPQPCDCGYYVYIGSTQTQFQEVMELRSTAKFGVYVLGTDSTSVLERLKDMSCNSPSNDDQVLDRQYIESVGLMTSNYS